MSIKSVGYPGLRLRLAHRHPDPADLVVSAPGILPRPRRVHSTVVLRLLGRLTRSSPRGQFRAASISGVDSPRSVNPVATDFRHVCLEIS